MNARIHNSALAWAAIALSPFLLGGCDGSGSAGDSDMDALAARLDPPKPVPVAEQPAAPATPPVAQAAPSRPGPQTSATALPGGIVTSADPDDLAGRAASHPAAAPQPAADALPPHVPAVSRGEGEVVGKRVYANKVNGVMRYYGAIASARNFMEDRILDAQIQKTLQLYVADHNDQFPKTNDEYMEHIIKEGMIQLPELPPGQEYFYDPSDHELKVGTVVDPPADAQPPATPAPAAAPPERR